MYQIILGVTGLCLVGWMFNSSPYMEIAEDPTIPRWGKKLSFLLGLVPFLLMALYCIFAVLYFIKELFKELVKEYKRVFHKE